MRSASSPGFKLMLFGLRKCNSEPTVDCPASSVVRTSEVRSPSVSQLRAAL